MRYSDEIDLFKYLPVFYVGFDTDMEPELIFLILKKSIIVLKLAQRSIEIIL